MIQVGISIIIMQEQLDREEAQMIQQNYGRTYTNINHSEDINSGRHTDQQPPPLTAGYQQQTPTADGGVRQADNQRVDRLIPTEEELLEEEFRYQQFLLQQQLLFSDFDAVPRTVSQRQLSQNRNRSARQASSRNMMSGDQQQEPLIQDPVVLAGQLEIERVHQLQNNRKRVIVISLVSFVLLLGFILLVVFTVI